MQSRYANSFSEWRDQARDLLSKGTHPSDVHWLNNEQAGLFDTYELIKDPPKSSLIDIKVPRQFLQMAKQAACYLDTSNPTHKWAVLYSLLWRLTFQHKATLSLRSDPEVRALLNMVKSVNRDQHKMKAFVRFKSSLQASNMIAQDEYFTAWFEPAHEIVEPTAPFFAKRFTGMAWSILTPHGCAHWDKQQLIYTSGTTRPELLEDDYETFWKVYYCNIFNPARLKEKAMMAEMPKKYWQYLPEAQCIKPLSNNAAGRQQKMFGDEPTNSNRLRERSQKLRLDQDELRSKNQK